ncbi:GbsR/MarR family transcriptional regulator [Sporolactobacillus sp. CPB3-1]|uniref:HTH-type transcriptional regulator n=1 Tax=Sporolactobacillus mangiferae TaxID=2940498 RepID=A0ABT0MAQ1_9BACL|nr:GbsR/MarR family transcriptional regulator [Sporolactobacillus mangiferae]
MDHVEIIENIRERVIESISQNMYLYGVSPSIGRLYGTLFFKGSPMTLDDMKEELKMSKTSMSTSVRTLSELNMVERVWRKGIRKDLYAAQEDWYQIFTDFFANQWRKVTSLNAKAVRQSLKELKQLMHAEVLSEDEKKQIQEDIDKYNYILAYYDWLNRLFDFLESEELYKQVKKKEEKPD